MNAEISHTIFRCFVSAFGKDNAQIPEPLRIRRPGEQTPTVSMRDLARRLRGGKG